MTPEMLADAVDELLVDDVARLDWPIMELEALQLERLRDLLAHAMEVSPWHRARLRDLDLDQLDLESFAGVPPMTKTDLLENWDGIVADDRLSLDAVEQHLQRVAEGGPLHLFDQYRVLATSGASGLRAPYVWDLPGWAEYGAATDRYNRWAQKVFEVPPPPVQVMVMATALTHMSAAMFHAFPPAGVRRCTLAATTPLNELVDELNDLQPDVLVAYPSVVERLAQEATAGRLQIQPMSIMAGGEAMEARTRAAAQEAFGVDCGNYYGATEAGVIAGGLPGAPLVIAEDKVLFEAVDEELQRVPAGARSASALVTNLINSTVPLVRYELADAVTWQPDDGGGPFSGRRLADVHGRRDDSFGYADGITIHPHAFRSPLSLEPWVREYQVIQTVDGATVAVCADDRPDVAGLAARLVGALRDAGITEPRVEVQVVDRIEAVPGTGKVRRFVPLGAGGLGGTA